MEQRQPPRFVPTLTEVIEPQWDEAVLLEEAPLGQPPSGAGLPLEAGSKPALPPEAESGAHAPAHGAPADRVSPRSVPSQWPLPPAQPAAQGASTWVGARAAPAWAAASSARGYPALEPSVAVSGAAAPVGAVPMPSPQATQRGAAQSVQPLAPEAGLTQAPAMSDTGPVARHLVEAAQASRGPEDIEALVQAAVAAQLPAVMAQLQPMIESALRDAVLRSLR